MSYCVGSAAYTQTHVRAAQADMSAQETGTMTADQPYQVLDPLSDDEYQALRADIEINGIQVPIVTDEDGLIIDGHNRKAIAAELGIPCPTTILTHLTSDEKTDRAFTLNLARRQLSREQRRQVIRRSLELNPELSNREHAKRCSTSHPTVAAVRREMDEPSKVESFTTSEPSEKLDPRSFFNSEEEFVYAMRFAECTDEQFEEALGNARAQGDPSQANVWRNVVRVRERSESDPEVKAVIERQLLLTQMRLAAYKNMQKLEQSEKWKDYATFDEFCRDKLGSSHYQMTVPRSVEDLIVDDTIVDHFGGIEAMAALFGDQLRRSGTDLTRYLSDVPTDLSDCSDDDLRMMKKTLELSISGVVQVGGSDVEVPRHIVEEAENTLANMSVRPDRIPQQYAILRALVTDFVASLSDW